MSQHPIRCILGKVLGYHQRRTPGSTLVTKAIPVSKRSMSLSAGRSSAGLRHPVHADRFGIHVLRRAGAQSLEAIALDLEASEVPYENAVPLVRGCRAQPDLRSVAGDYHVSGGIRGPQRVCTMASPT